MDKKLLKKTIDLVEGVYNDSNRFPIYINLKIIDSNNVKILYRQYKYLEHPVSLYTLDIIEYLKTFPEDIVITSKHLMEKYNITNINASVRLQRLQRWGFLNYKDRSKKARGGYLLADYTKSKSKKGGLENADGTRNMDKY